MASVNINDELRNFAEREAERRGFSGADAYVERLLEEAQSDRANGGAQQDPASIAHALAELDELRAGSRLDGLSIRELIEEGRRL